MPIPKNRMYPSFACANRTGPHRRPPQAVTEDTASAARDAPAYANSKEKHIAVPPLQPGDILEYEIVTRIVHPIAAQEFWAQHAFLRDAIVLDERLEVSVPRAAA